jgi:hypothetical protein
VAGAILLKLIVEGRHPVRRPYPCPVWRSLGKFRKRIT